MRIGLLADVHYRADESEGFLSTLAETVDRLDDAGVDRIVVLGDLVHDSDSAETDRRNLRRVVEVIDAADAPTRYLPGNHDVANLSPAAFERITGTETPGRDGDCLFLDSTVPGSPVGRGEVGEEQRSWLASRLADRESAIAFTHHPVHYRDVGSNRWFGETPEQAFASDKALVHEALADGDAVRAVCNGHLHETAHVEYEGVHHFTVNSFNKELEPDAATGGYAVVEVAEEGELTVTSVEGSGVETRTRLPPE